MATPPIADCFLFKKMTSDQRQALLSLGREESFAQGDRIINETAPADTFYILLSGRVTVEISAIHHKDASKAKVQLALLRPGDVFGEKACLGGPRRCANVTAVDPVQVLAFEGAVLNDMLERQTAIGYRFMANLARTLAIRLEKSNLSQRDDIRIVT